MQKVLIMRSSKKCIDCGECEKHWPGIKKRFNGQGFFELDYNQMRELHGHFEEAISFCPGDEEKEGISREVKRHA